MKRFFPGSVLFVTLYLGCSVPILESEACIAAREPVKRLFSLHLDRSSTESDQIARIQEYASPELIQKIRGSQTDYVTKSSDLPKAARVGACTDSNNGPQFEVLLFWRRNDVNEERRVIATAKEIDKWVVNEIESPN